jgi:opacity protein-like surface antigen
MLKKIICYVALFLTLTVPAFAQSLSIGGGLLSPHSEEDDYTLDGGYSIVAMADVNVYEKKYFDLDIGFMYAYMSYDEMYRPEGNSSNAETKDKEHSNIFSVYTKPTLKIYDFKPYILGGVGYDTEYTGGPTYSIGAGLDYYLEDNWTIGISALYMESSQRIYRIRPIFSIRYKF